eukprot:1451342-Prymnesium_polylepis.1
MASLTPFLQSFDGPGVSARRARSWLVPTQSVDGRECATARRSRVPGRAVSRVARRGAEARAAADVVQP